MKAAEQEIYNEALRYATEKHEGQKRKDGVPYIMHPVAVSEIVREWGYGLEYQVTALFHDLLEDTDAEESEIERIGGPEVLKAVRLLTKTEGYVMSEYVDGMMSEAEGSISAALEAIRGSHNAFRGAGGKTE